MAVTTTKTNKPLNPRGNDQSPKGYNRAELYTGKALDFDGVNDQMTGEASNLPSSNYTICTYFKLDTEKTSAFIVWGDDTTGERRGILIWDDGHAGDFTLRSSTYGSNPEGDTVLETDKWYFGCVSVASDGEAKIYLNGQLDGTGTNTLNAYTNTDYVVGNSRSNEWTNGQIANTRVFSEVLTAAQVADLYNNPEKIVPTGVADSALKLWLPMMEGAGTTAYDGSGNGNHGTISGATWTHGIGAPVAQTAVIDWNKGTNLIPYSEELDNSSSAFTLRGFVQNSSTETSPIGTSDAYKFTENDTNSNPALYWNADYSDGNSQTFKVYLKADAATTFSISTEGAVEGDDINVTTEWAQYEVTQSVNTNSGPHIGGFLSIARDSGVVLYVWHPQLSYGDSVYVPTLATAQTSDVLLPAGLTTGRDITGVNLFENVRKQGALNLDGNSWAEVHDNSSLDMTDAITLEAWVYWDYSNTTQGGILGRWNSGEANYLLFKTNANNVRFYINALSSQWSGMTTGWHHIVGTYDKTNRKLYVDGSLKATDAMTANIGTGTSPIDIGQNYGGSNKYDEAIAQPRIYNRALTAEEVERNYNAGKNIYK